MTILYIISYIIIAIAVYVICMRYEIGGAAYGDEIEVGFVAISWIVSIPIILAITAIIVVIRIIAFAIELVLDIFD